MSASRKLRLSATSGLPPGGTQAQVLAKQSSTDGDAAWQSFLQLQDLYIADSLAAATNVHLGSGADYFSLSGDVSGLPTAMTAWFNASEDLVWQFTHPLFVNDDQVWHAGNDGAGSGLDADFLDGQHGSYFLNYANFTGTPPGGLPAGGATNDMIKKNSAAAGDASWSNTHTLKNLTIVDPALPTTYANLATASGIFALAGQVNGLNASLYAQDNAGTPAWNFSHAVFIAGGYVWTSLNDGVGSGLDADKLDGFEASEFARKSAAETITGIWSHEAGVNFGGGSYVTSDGDFLASRGAAPTTGVYFFGDGSRYLYFDGGAFQLIGGPLRIQGGTGGVVSNFLTLSSPRAFSTSPDGVQVNFVATNGTLGTHDFGAMLAGHNVLTGNGGGGIMQFRVGGSSSASTNGRFMQAEALATGSVDAIRFYTGAPATEKFGINSAGRLYGKAIDVGHNNGANVAGTTNQYIASGTWTPTVTDEGNVSALSTGGCQYLRVGNVVSFSGFVNVTPASGGASCYLSFTVPINSAFAGYENACGSGCDAGGLNEAVALYATGTPNRIFMRFYAATTTPRAISFSGCYLII